MEAGDLVVMDLELDSPRQLKLHILMYLPGRVMHFLTVGDVPLMELEPADA